MGSYIMLLTALLHHWAHEEPTICGDWRSREDVGVYFCISTVSINHFEMFEVTLERFDFKTLRISLFRKWSFFLARSAVFICRNKWRRDMLCLGSRFTVQVLS